MDMFYNVSLYTFYNISFLTEGADVTKPGYCESVTVIEKQTIELTSKLTKLGIDNNYPTYSHLGCFCPTVSNSTPLTRRVFRFRASNTNPLKVPIFYKGDCIDARLRARQARLKLQFKKAPCWLLFHTIFYLGYHKG